MGKTKLLLHRFQASHSSRIFPTPFLFLQTLFSPRLGHGGGAMKPQMAHLGIPLGLLLAALIILAVCARRCEEAGFGGHPGPKPHLTCLPGSLCPAPRASMALLAHLPCSTLHCLHSLLSLLLTSLAPPKRSFLFCVLRTPNPTLLQAPWSCLTPEGSGPQWALCTKGRV